MNIEELSVKYIVKRRSIDIILNDEEKRVRGFLVETHKHEELLKDIPDGYYLYYIRHSDKSLKKPSTIENYVCVNFYGYFLTETKLDIKKDGYAEIIKWRKLAPKRN